MKRSRERKQRENRERERERDTQRNINRQKGCVSGIARERGGETHTEMRDREHRAESG